MFHLILVGEERQKQHIIFHLICFQSQTYKKERLHCVYYVEFSQREKRINDHHLPLKRDGARRFEFEEEHLLCEKSKSLAINFH
jgi:hypothetical protein